MTDLSDDRNNNPPSMCLKEAKLPPQKPESPGRRDAILKTVHRATQRFLKGPLGKGDIEEIFAQLGLATDADRVYIFKNQMGADGMLLTSQLHEWVFPGIDIQMNNPKLQHRSFAGFERWQTQLSRGRCIVGQVREFPQGERVLLAGQRIVSIAVAPVFIGETWWGFIGFDACRSERRWSSVEIDALKTAANIIGAAIQHRRFDEALKDSERRYRALADATFEAIFISEKGLFLEANYRASDMFGYVHDEFVGLSATDIFAPVSRELVSRKIGSGCEKPHEAVGLRKNGSMFYVEIRGKTMAYNGKTVRVMVIRDIDEQKGNEKALEESRERFKSLAEHAPFGLSIMQSDRQFEYFNPKFRAIFGYTRDDIPDKPTWFEKAYPDKNYRDRVRTVWNNDFRGVVSAGEVAVRTFKVRCKDGRDKVIRFKNVALSGSRQLLSYEDITRQAKAEKQLKRSEKKLQYLTSGLLTAQENERRQMSMELHDDLGQRLAVLKLQIDALANRLSDGRIEQTTDCGLILNYLSEIIEYVREISHGLSSSGIHDLGLTAALKHLFKSFNASGDVRVMVERMPDLIDLFSKETEVVIYRIFQEAITNVFRHANATTITIAIRRHKHKMQFVVEDDGVGFSVNKFVAAGPADKGLGLAAMEERVRMIEGQLEILSRLKRGTRISFSVPTL